MAQAGLTCVIAHFTPVYLSLAPLGSRTCSHTVRSSFHSLFVHQDGPKMLQPQARVSPAPNGENGGGSADMKKPAAAGLAVTVTSTQSVH